MVSLLAILIFSIPLALSSSSSVEPDTVLSTSFFVLLLVFSCLWVVIKGVSWQKLRPIKHPLFFFAFSLAFAMIFLIGQSGDLWEIVKYALGFILFILIAPLSESDKERIASIIVGTAFFISLLALYQYFFGFQVLLNYVKETKITDPFVLEKIAAQRVFFPFPTPAILGGYLAMILPLTLTPQKRVVCFLTMSFALLLTKSLGALLSLAIVFTAFLLIQTHFRRKKALALLTLVIILGSIFALRAGSSGESLLPSFSLASRLHYWKETWKIICAHPWTGVGFGRFALRESSYAHNFFLQLWAEAGLASIVSFLWLITATLKHSLGASCRPLGAGFAAGVFIFLIHNLMDFSLFLPAVSFIGWIMLGLLYFPGSQPLEKDQPGFSPEEV